MLGQFGVRGVGIVPGFESVFRRDALWRQEISEPYRNRNDRSCVAGQSQQVPSESHGVARHSLGTNGVHGQARTAENAQPHGNAESTAAPGEPKISEEQK